MSFVVSAGALVPASSSSPRRGAPAPAIQPRGIGLYPGLMAAYDVIYREQPNVRTVVDFLSRNIAQLNFKLFERVSDTERRHLFDTDLAYLLRHPNPFRARYAFFRELVADLGIFDNYLAVKWLMPDGRRALVRMLPQWAEVLGESPIYPEGYRFNIPGRAPLELPRANVVHIYGYNPSESRWGCSPIETLRRILAEDAAAGHAREQLWTRGPRASAVITRPADAPKWGAAARERFRSGFVDAFSGNGPEAGGVPILEDGMTIEQVSMTPAELEYLGARKLTRAEVAAAYHVSPSMVGMLDSANISTAESDHKRLYQDTLAPWTQQIGEELSLQLIGDYYPGDRDTERYIEADLQAKLRGDFLAEAEASSRAVGAPWLTRNEQRARNNLPPVDGGDELITPLNVTSGGRANPADTAPGTPGLGQASRTARSVKAAPASSDPWIAQHVALIADFVGRQRASVLSKLGAGLPPAEAFELNDAGRMPRWDGELHELLAGLALSVAEDAAAPVSASFDATFDVDAATPWLVNSARVAAETFNDATLTAVNDLWPAPTSRRQAADPEEPVIADVFDAAAGERAQRFGTDRARSASSFARYEAASQAGATTKTWRTTSSTPRASHAALNGVTVGIGDTFANGGRWPHDPALSTDESAGCTCRVDFTEAPRST